MKLHYLWVGSPSTIKIGHDVDGPRAMDSICNNAEIIFWCLENYLEYYKKAFQNTKITVQAIEDTLKPKEEKDENNIREKVFLYYKFFLKSDNKSVRNRVAFKNTFSLYVLYLFGGYALDTNIFPNKSTVNFCQYEEMTIPMFSFPPKEEKDVECWMMYSPEQSKETITSTIHDYFKNLESICNFKNFLNSESTYQSLSIAMIKALLDNSDSMNPWMINDLIDKSGETYLAELGVKKEYYNTHKFGNRLKYNSIGDLSRPEIFAFFKKTSLSSLSDAKHTMYDLILDYTRSG